MKPKVLFLKTRSGRHDYSPPLAFAFLGQIAMDKGFDVIIENLDAQYSQTTVDDVVNLVKREKPLIIGFSILTNYAFGSYEMMKLLRKDSKIIIAGGPHVTIFPGEVVEHGADISIIGEGEITFSELLDAINSQKELDNIDLAKLNLAKIRGLAYKEGKKIRITKPREAIANLDVVPIPNKDLFRKSDYMLVEDEASYFGNILSTRGCPGQCTYCYHSLFGRGYRYRSAKNVFREVVDVHKKYGVKHIDFIDDAFTINKQRLYELCDLLIKAKLPITWRCATRVDFLDKESIFRMADAGCVMINIGFENNVPHTLRRIKKTSNPEWYVNHHGDVLKWCYDAGVRVVVNILSGFPWDTVEDIRELRTYIKSIRQYVTQGFLGGVLYPLPHTEIYDEYAKEKGFENWWLYREPVIKDSVPFFKEYYHLFWDQIQNNFFKLDKKVMKEIDSLYRYMGKWNLLINVRIRFKNPLAQFTLFYGLLGLSAISMILYKISPTLENKIMYLLTNFGHRFKFKEAN